MELIVKFKNGTYVFDVTKEDEKFFELDPRPDDGKVFIDASEFAYEGPREYKGEFRPAGKETNNG